jgi:hypothetical protein
VEVRAFALARAVTYAALFIGLVLVYLPARLVAWSGIVRPATLGVQQVAGMALGFVAAAAALATAPFRASGRVTLIIRSVSAKQRPRRAPAK